MKDVAIFLAAWFLISDAASTINSAAVLFAKTELQMSAPSLAVIGVMVVFLELWVLHSCPSTLFLDSVLVIPNAVLFLLFFGPR